MTAVDRLAPGVSSSLKRFFCILVKQSFWRKFGFQCPQSLHRIRDLSFLPHLIKSTVPWRHIRIYDLQNYFQLSPENWDDCIYSHEIKFDEHPQLIQVGNDLLNYRITVRQALPTRLKTAFSWNMNSWQGPKSCREDQKMRRIKKLLKVGPVLLQETKWHHNQEEILLQHISGLQIASTNAVCTDNNTLSGGVAVLLPAGWIVSQRIVLLPGRSIAVLVNDRCTPYYLISVYLHPDHVQSELEHIINVWRDTEKKSDKIVIGGDFNQADVKCPETWKRFLALFTAIDVHPSLATYLFTGGSSALDRFLVPEEWVSTARWNPEVRTLSSSLVNGHKILKVNVKVRPTVLNNPNDCLHETIPTEAFIPGKNGRIPKDNRALQSLVRLLHRTHSCLRDPTVQADGFKLDDGANRQMPTDIYHLPKFEDNKVPNQLLPSSKRELESEDMFGSGDEQTRSSLVGPQAMSGCADLLVGQEVESHDIRWNFDTVSCESYSFRQQNIDAHDANIEVSTWRAQLSNLHLSISACFWSWWRSLPPEANPAHNKPFLKARKFVHLPAQWVNVPKYIVEDLIAQSQGVVLSSLDGLTISNGSVSLPRTSIQAMFEVIDDYLTGTPYVPSDSTDSQVRGLGTMVAFWVLQSDGSQCLTSSDLDCAMLATRDFWFQDPQSSHSDWDCVLNVYEDTQAWPEIELPNKQMLLDTLLHTKDSAPGPDGLPYAAWRLLPEVTVEAMMSYFYDILDETALPPLQVGVWIPKAKMGPEADNFRPLGMPNTLERLVDGTAAAQVMRVVAPTMHPSQTVMSMFKEPQRAVTGIQNLLDSSKATCSLLADLSKAFERVNPHWIIRLLRIKRAPKWVITYTRFILFNRRVTHKVQGRLLPSRTILQGVDMGRSFSVFLFCFAMDPLFHYLNRIPNVLAVEAYVDDTTIIGDAQSLDWIREVSLTYQKVSTAGFIVDSHACYRALQNSVMRFAPKKLTDEELVTLWPSVAASKPYGTVSDALKENYNPGYNTLIVRMARPRLRDRTSASRLVETVADHLVVNYNFAQVKDILRGRHMHSVGAFATASCSCKSKSQVVTNFALRPAATKSLEQSGYGIHAIAPCAPSLGLALVGRVQLNEEGVWKDTPEPETLYDTKPAPFKKFSQRLQTFRAPTLSIVARCTCFNTYIVSVMPYTASYFGLSTTDLNLLR